MAALSRAVRAWLRSYGLYAVAALVILAPLLGRGFIMTLDMVGTPRFPMPEQLTNSYLFNAALHLLSYALPGDIIQKFILLAILLLSGIGMHRLALQLFGAAQQPPWTLYAAGLFYMVNPFTYGRFMGGQYAVLLGYALVPWLLHMACRFARQPSQSLALRIGLLTTVIAIISIHTLGLVAVLAVAGGIAMVSSRQTTPWRSYVRSGWIAAAIFLLANCYWLMPLLAGKGRTAETITMFSSNDIAAFATTGTNMVNQLVHIARLQGFWAEGRELFLMPQHAVPMWGIAVLILWIGAGYGIVQLWRTRRHLAVFLCITIFGASFMALGLVGEWGYAHLPFVAGFREPHKFVGLLALADSLCIAAAVGSLLRKYRASEVRKAIVATLALLLPVVLTPTMFWGFNRQLQPRHYPADWYTINQQLTADTDRFTVVFLPWHQYMSYGFAQRIIASPGEPFFDKPILASDDPEIKGAIATTATAETRGIGKLLAGKGQNRQLGRSLSEYGVKYILVAKDFDYRKYDYLSNQSDLYLVRETATLKLYSNPTWSTR